MKYLEYFESRIADNKHTLQEYCDNEDLLKYENWDFKKTDHDKGEIVFLGFTNKDDDNLRVTIHKFINKKNVTRDITIVFFENHNTIVQEFPQSNIKRFDFQEFLNESIRYYENYFVYKTLISLDNTINDFIINIKHPYNIMKLKTFQDLKNFNDRVDEMKIEYDYILSAKNMGLL